MALFANTTAADFKKGDIIMFAMGSSSPGQVAMYYGLFSTIVDVVVGVDSAMRKGRERV